MKGFFKKGFIPKGKDEVKKAEEPETISNSLVSILEMSLIAMLLQVNKYSAKLTLLKIDRGCIS